MVSSGSAELRDELGRSGSAPLRATVRGTPARAQITFRLAIRHIAAAIAHDFVAEGERCILRCLGTFKPRCWLVMVGRWPACRWPVGDAAFA